MNIKIPLSLSNVPAAVLAKFSQFSRTQMRAVWLAVGYRFVGITRDNFGPFGAHRPSPWAPLSEKYMKRIKYFGPPKLVLHGHLWNAFNFTGNSNGVRILNRTEYAEVHQFGGGNNVPARPYLPITKSGRLTAYAARELVARFISKVKEIRI